MGGKRHERGGELRKSTLQVLRERERKKIGKEKRKKERNLESITQVKSVWKEEEMGSN